MTILTCKLNNNISVFQIIYFQLNSELQNLRSNSNIIYKNYEIDFIHIILHIQQIRIFNYLDNYFTGILIQIEFLNI